MTTRAIVLADERSQRIVNGSGHMKAMAKIAGLPLIIRNLRTLHAAGVNEAVVVTGYQAHRIEAALRGYHVGIDVTVVHNENWWRGGAYSVLAAAPWIDRPVVLVPSDHLYPPSLIRNIFNHPAPVETVVMAVDRRVDEVFDADECLKVRLDGNAVTDIGVAIEDPDGVCPGIVRISPAMVSRLARVMADVEISLLDALRGLARHGKLRMLTVNNGRWISITSPQARRFAELLITVYGDTLEIGTDREDTILLNPGPVTTSPRVKAAVGARDMCHREPDFSGLLDSVRRKLHTVFGGGAQHEILLVTSSGTGGIEAALSTFVPRNKKLLVLVNGSFGQRQVDIAHTYGIETRTITAPWGAPIDLDELARVLDGDPDIAAVSMVHHETSMAVLNPVGAVGAIVRGAGRLLIVDAVSSLGAEDIDVTRDNIDVCVSSANKCLHAFSGVASICVHQRAWDAVAADSPRTYYLDLRRYRHYARHLSQTPFTPAVNTLLSLDAALEELLETGGVAARNAHYRKLSAALRSGLQRLGLELLIDEERASSSVTIVKVPEDLTFGDIYQGLKQSGFIVYECKGDLAGKYFQVANMGDLEETHIEEFLVALQRVLDEVRARPSLLPLTATSA